MMRKLIATAAALLLAFTAAATPIGDNLPLPTVTQEASAASVYKQRINGKEYELAVFPMKTVNLTQGENTFSHKGTFAIDIVGQKHLTAPFTCKVMSISTSNNAVTLESVDKVIWADGTLDYATIRLAHDNNISDLPKGKIVKQGESFYSPGTKGQVTGAHVHMAVGRGKAANNTLKKTSSTYSYNSKTYYTYKLANEVHANNMLFITDDSTVKNSKGLSFKKVSTCKSSNTQTASNSKSDVGTGFIATIKNKKNGKFLTVNKSTNNVSVAKATGAEDQQFLFTRMSDGTYEIKNILTNKNLDIDNAGTANGTNVQVYKDNNTSAQRFVIKGTASSFTISLAYTNKAIDADGGNSNVHIWTPYSNFDAQTFEITKITGTSGKFAKPTVSNLTTDNAKIATTAYKNKGATGKTFAIEVFDKNGDLQKYEFKTEYPKSTSNKIDFTLKKECKFTLKTKTKYSYRFKSTYIENGKTTTYYSPIYSFTTK